MISIFCISNHPKQMVGQSPIVCNPNIHVKVFHHSAFTDKLLLLVIIHCNILEVLEFSLYPREVKVLSINNQCNSHTYTSIQLSFYGKTGCWRADTWGVDTYQKHFWLLVLLALLSGVGLGGHLQCTNKEDEVNNQASLPFCFHRWWH